MKFALGVLALVIGAVLLFVGLARANEALILVAFILIPAGFFYGSQLSSHDDEYVGGYHAASPYDAE